MLPGQLQAADRPVLVPAAAGGQDVEFAAALRRGRQERRRGHPAGERGHTAGPPAPHLPAGPGLAEVAVEPAVADRAADPQPLSHAADERQVGRLVRGRAGGDRPVQEHVPAQRGDLLRFVEDDLGGGGAGQLQGAALSGP